MRSLKNLLQEKRENEEFRIAFEKESKLAAIAIQIAKRREGKGFTQKQLAGLARISQQQISKVERAGVSGLNLGTLLRVCDALDLDISLNPREDALAKGRSKSQSKHIRPNRSVESAAAKFSVSKKRSHKRIAKLSP